MKLIASLFLLFAFASVGLANWGGGLSASGNTYMLKKEHGQWKVTSDKMLCIS